MSHITGECKVNSPIECEFIDFNFDQYDQFSQWSENRVTKMKVKIMIEECQNRNVCRFYLFPLGYQRQTKSKRNILAIGVI